MDTSLGLFVAVGFLAQLIDGAMGMAYGVTSTTFLLSLGVPPALASAGVHTAEVFTTLASGLAHWRLGNVDWHLVKRLVVPGVVGGALGAYVLSSVPAQSIKPYVAGYLLLMGLVIVARSFKRTKTREVRKGLIPLGAVGGFLDAIGGGGWGPIVTSTLVARGNHPRFTIGSVNLTEFFVTVAEAATFFTLIGLAGWRIIVGLLLGGVLAAPVAACVLRILPTRWLMLAVGLIIIALQARTLWLALA
ncbi:sulfite exporter TauE/SafE family protein [Candidatus Bipolaricaulota bacterium]|nr:sulfite exporter TauE/SafE family protein [Candidatus Bipolaricaulota bacterium]